MWMIHSAAVAAGNRSKKDQEFVKNKQQNKKLEPMASDTNQKGRKYSRWRENRSGRNLNVGLRLSDQCSLTMQRPLV